MPTFSEFDYFFAVDELKISLATLALQSIYSGVFIFVYPILY